MMNKIEKIICKPNEPVMVPEMEFLGYEAYAEFDRIDGTILLIIKASDVTDVTIDGGNTVFSGGNLEISMDCDEQRVIVIESGRYLSKMEDGTYRLNIHFNSGETLAYVVQVI